MCVGRCFVINARNVNNALPASEGVDINAQTAAVPQDTGALQPEREERVEPVVPETQDSNGGVSSELLCPFMLYKLYTRTPQVL